MASRIKQYATALVTSLNTNSGSWSQTMTAVRKNFPYLEREDLDDGDVVCYVTPGRQIRRGRSRTRLHTREFELEIHLAIGLDPLDQDETDAALDLADEIENWIDGNAFELSTGGYTAGLESILQEDVMDDDSLHQRNEFETLITLAYREES